MYFVLFLLLTTLFDYLSFVLNLVKLWLLLVVACLGPLIGVSLDGHRECGDHGFSDDVLL